jgi:hypothetical protein
MTAHIFDLESLLHIEQYAWIVDKANPNIPLMKITESDLNLIKNGIYKSHGNLVIFNGKKYYLPNNLMNELKIRSKNQKIGLSNLGISMQEFLNDNITEDLKVDVLKENFNHLKNTTDDIYIICTKLFTRTHTNAIKLVEKKLEDAGLKVKQFIYINKSLYSQDNDLNAFKKSTIILEKMLGYKIAVDKFLEKGDMCYDTVCYYDDKFPIIQNINRIDDVYEFVRAHSDKNIVNEIHEYINKYEPKLITHLVTTNKFNLFEKKEIVFSEFKKIRMYESFTRIEAFGKMIKESINSGADPKVVNLPDGEYTGFINGYTTTIDSPKYTFKTTNGLRNVAPIKCKIIIKNGHAVVYHKDGILFSDDDARNIWKDKYGNINNDPEFKK